jgi:hypothetical protein
MYYQRFVITLTLCAIVAFTNFASAAEEQKQKKEGSTSVKGAVDVVKKGDVYKIDLNVEVRKSGVSGTGKGVLEFQLFDENYELKKPIRVQRTVGAVPRGSSTKSEGKSLTLPADRFNGCIWGIAVSDSIGFPTSLKELEHFLKKTYGQDLKPADVIKGLKSGETKSFGDFSIKRF